MIRGETLERYKNSIQSVDPSITNNEIEESIELLYKFWEIVLDNLETIEK